ncbi:hypothetical protein CRM22_009477 [Opisthorchis felineus]|uniref:Uncharacterized protein n=1 Tax=Opisthorchis felineus TaxID=147828 RepID=A0A4S2L8R3_OPIFE|nr:hypothetical protein CRM22_009477 [Opisthorchis felineus]
MRSLALLYPKLATASNVWRFLSALIFCTISWVLKPSVFHHFTMVWFVVPPSYWHFSSNLDSQTLDEFPLLSKSGALENSEIRKRLRYVLRGTGSSLNWREQYGRFLNQRN